MDNNKNNNANIAEEKNNNNTMLYILGIVGLVALIIGIVWYYSSKKSEKKQDEAELISETHALINNGFVEKDCYDACKGGANPDEKKKVQEKYLAKEDSTKVWGDCQKKKKDISELQQKIKKQVAAYLIGQLSGDLKGLEGLKNYEGEHADTVQNNIGAALTELGKIKDAKDYPAVKAALEEAKKKLNECVVPGYSAGLWHGEWAYVSKNKDGDKAAYDIITKKVQEIEAILELIKDAKGEENVAKYSREALDKALATWEKDYQKLCNQCAVIEGLGLDKEKKKESNEGKTGTE